MAGWDDHVFAAAAVVRAHLAQDAALALPEVRDAAGAGAGGQLDDQRPGLAEVEEVQGVRRGRIRRDQSEPIAVAHVVREVRARCAEDLVVLRAPLRIGHQRQRPQVGLAGHLVVELIEDESDVATRRQLTLELHPAQTTRQRTSLHQAPPRVPPGGWPQPQRPRGWFAITRPGGRHTPATETAAAAVGLAASAA